jgi:hypothetical protein
MTMLSCAAIMGHYVFFHRQWKNAEIGDFTSDTSPTSRPSSNLEGEKQTCPSEDLNCEGEERIEAVLPVNHNHINQQVTNRVTFGKSNSCAIEYPTQPIDWQMPDPSGVASGQNFTFDMVSGQNFTSGAASGQNFASGTASGHKLTSGAVSGHNIGSGPAFGHKFASGVASGHHMASGLAFGHNLASGTASGHNMASGPAFGHNFASGAASGQNLAFGCNKLFELITAFGHVKLISHVGHITTIAKSNPS